MKESRRSSSPKSTPGAETAELEDCFLDPFIVLLKVRGIPVKWWSESQFREESLVHRPQCGCPQRLPHIHQVPRSPRYPSPELSFGHERFADPRESQGRPRALCYGRNIVPNPCSAKRFGRRHRWRRMLRLPSAHLLPQSALPGRHDTIAERAQKLYLRALCALGHCNSGAV